MAAIRSADTKPELTVRKALHARGFRYSLHNKLLPGKPDLAFQKYKAVLFVHGCFWHGHDCPMFKWPKTRDEFWHRKIVANKVRDVRNNTDLRAAGWRIGIVWECSLKGKHRLERDVAIDSIGRWLSSDALEFCIRGTGGD